MSFADEPQPTGERITLSGHNSPELPHWTDPPTGEVPRILADDPHAREDDLRAWQALGSRGLRWRDEASDWDVEALPDLGSEETRVGALDTTRTEHSDLYSFDEAFERLEEERSGAHPAVAPLGLDPDAEDAVAAPPPPRSRTRRPPPAPRRRRPARPGAPPARGPGGPPSGGRNLASAVGVGVGLVVLLLILYAVGPAALLVLSALVIGAASAEGYGMLQRAGFRPATLLGLVSAVAIVFAAYWRGVDALPLVVVLTFAASMLWYLLGIVEARPLANVAVTNLMFVWVGVLGSFAALMLRAHDGKGLFLGAVVVAVGSDIAAFFAGSSVGNRQMAPEVSPGKTWEGAVAGFVAAIVVGAIVGKTLAPWGGIKHGLVLGVIVGIVAPIGDLAESMVKRDLGLKDSGSALPGHGGLLDRFDSILLILPAAYYLATYTHILK
jgi:phosphatidate cytidylyltransferase